MSNETVSEPSGSKPKLIEDGAKFLRETGLLFEINRVVLHPLGLALSIKINEDETHAISNKLWDYRDDPEGLFFGDESFASGTAKLNLFMQEFGTKKFRERYDLRGLVIQDRPYSEIVKEETA